MLERIFPNLMARRQRRLAEFNRLRIANRMLERMPEWAEDPDEDEWVVLQNLQAPYTESDLKTMREKARSMYYKSPSARGIIESMILFVIGRHASVTATNKKAQEYWENWCRANKWDERSREIVRRTLRDGEIFARFFTPKDKTLMPEKPDQKYYTPIRFIEPGEIKDNTNTHSHGIETDPDDVETILNYYREFSKNNVEQKEKIPAEEVIHLKILCDSNDKRGVSFFVGIAKYIKEYEKWLGDRIRLNRIRTIFNLLIKPEGMSPASFKAKFQDETTTPSGKTASKKIPKPGSAVIAQGVDYEYKSLDLKAADTANDGRAIERMICKATMLVEGIVTGDYSNQNYASSLVAESPMVKMVESWQDVFDNLFQAIFAKVIQRAKQYGQIGKEIEETCECEFATMVHRELDKDTAAYQIHRQNRWASDKTISTKLGYDYDAEQEQIKKEDAAERQSAQSAELPPEEEEF